MREFCESSTEAGAPRTTGRSNDEAAGANLAIGAFEDGKFVVDLYSWLGVSRSASADEIRRAYYTRAMALHPDRNPESATSAETLKSITRGASILRDPRMRRLYDRGDIDASGRLTAAGASRRRWSNVTRTFGVYFLGPFATGLAVVVALLWTQVPVTAGVDPKGTTEVRPIAALAASATVDDASAIGVGVTRVEEAPPERLPVAAPEQYPVAAAPTPRVIEAATAMERPSNASGESKIAAADFEALAASAASNLAREIARRVSAPKSAVSGKSVKAEVVSALKRGRGQAADSPSPAVARKAAGPTVLALNGKPEARRGEGHAFERPSCALTKACRTNEAMCGC